MVDRLKAQEETCFNGITLGLLCIGLAEPIERNPFVFDWVRFPNAIQLNLMDWVRLGSISSEIEFTQIAELNRTQSMDWDWLSLIFERSIYYAGIKKRKKEDTERSVKTI